MKRKSVRSGIRTHAGRTRLRPERSALDRLAIRQSPTNVTVIYFVDYYTINHCVKWKGKMSEVGFDLKPGETDCDLNAAP